MCPLHHFFLKATPSVVCTNRVCETTYRLNGVKAYLCWNKSEGEGERDIVSGWVHGEFKFNVHIELQ